MSDSYEDYYQPRFTESSPSVAALQARILELEAGEADQAAIIDYWREAFKHCLQVKGGCSCQGRAEKLWCKRCRYMDRYETETGEQCR
jgi:hypothetical protein